MVKSISDKCGNTIYSTENGNLLTLKLKLKGEKRMRNIGMVNIRTKTFIIKRERKKHLFRKGNAYGLNDFVLRNTQTFDRVVIMDDFESWEISVKDILEKGFYLNFKEEGFELQIFIKLEDLKPYKIKSYV